MLCIHTVQTCKQVIQGEVIQFLRAVRVYASGTDIFALVKFGTEASRALLAGPHKVQDRYISTCGPMFRLCTDFEAGTSWP